MAERLFEIKRSFYPGEDWVYYKIYCSKETSNQLLIGSIKKTIDQLFEKKVINKWFFVRYRDPDYHIRLRFKLNRNQDIIVAMKLLKKNLIDYLESNLIWKFQIDTYEREIERYDQLYYETLEDIFAVDSEMAIKAMDFAKNEEQLVLFAIKLIDDTYELFGIDQSRKLEMAKTSLYEFQFEHNIDTGSKKELNKKYKNLRIDLDYMFSNKIKGSNLALLKILNARFTSITKIENLYKLKVRDLSDNVLWGIIHMNVNRIFISNQRYFEMVCYDFLIKYYKSKLFNKHN